MKLYAAALTAALGLNSALAHAQDGLFIPLGGGLSSVVQGATAQPGPGGRPQAGIVRSRRVAVDFALLGERTQGVQGPAEEAPPLVFNFFDDAEIRVQVDSVEPAAIGAGYVVTGSLPGQPGTVVFAVHVDESGSVTAVSGSASTAEGSFRISTVGGGVYSVEEIDASAPKVDAPLPETPEPDAAPDAGEPGAPPSEQGAAASSQIDVLVLYTPAAAAQAGGTENMFAEIERLFGETNAAFRDSGVNARIAGWAREIDYTESGDTGDDLDRLQRRGDGHLDEAHALRTAAGADLVHLLVAFTPEAGDDGAVTCGVAFLDVRREYGFGVTLMHRYCQYTFTHELGHNLGLSHDRYQNFEHGRRRPARRPYAYGYSNAATFSPIAGGQCWNTVMAYYKHCYDTPGGRFLHANLLRFSNPHMRHWSGEPLGVLGERETYRAAGPADAARSLNETRARVAAYARRPDPPAPTGLDAAVKEGSVDASPAVIDAGGRVTVEAEVENAGAGFIRSSTASFWSRYDEPGAEWVRRASKTPGALAEGSSKAVSWRGTGGTEPGAQYWAVCIAADGDIDPDNNCRTAGRTVAVRDPDAVDGGQLSAEDSGRLKAAATGEVEFGVSDATGEPFQIQPHWFLLSYEPVTADVWGSVQAWTCFEEDRSTCGDEDAEWDWGRRMAGFGAGGSFLTFLGVEAYSWSDGDRWRFIFGEAVAFGEEKTTELDWRVSVVRVTEDRAGTAAAAARGGGAARTSKGRTPMRIPGAGLGAQTPPALRPMNRGR